MTLKPAIDAAVADWLAAGNAPATLSAQADPYQCDLDLAGYGLNGLTCRGIEYRGPDNAPTGWTLQQVHDWGQRLADRVTYLLEPLSIIEADPDQGVQLRSTTPSTQPGGAASYYEAILRTDGTAGLKRRTVDPATRQRRDIEAHLTLEVVGRLADDLIASEPSHHTAP